MSKYHASTDTLPHAQYDFIIVGGGTAGCVLANRLTENKNVKVLVIEAGESAESNSQTHIPFLGVTLPGTDLDWKFTTVPQPGLNGRVIPCARGMSLGGTTTINLLTWNRGANDVWNRWAQLTGDEGWSWEKVKEYYKKTHTLVSHPEIDLINPSIHGTLGPLEINLPGHPTQLDRRVKAAAKELGGRFAWNDDLNSGDCVGTGYMPSTVKSGMRSSAFTAYLQPILHRENLSVLTGWQATRLVKCGEEGLEPAVRAVEIAKGGGTNETRKILHAKNEVLLTAGVVGSPHLLLLSGIGPSKELSTHKLPVLVDSPHVGKHWSDHVYVANHFLVNSTETFDKLLRNPAEFDKTMGVWMAEKKGLFVDSPANTQAFWRLPCSSTGDNSGNGWDKEKWGLDDPASGPGSGHTEVIFVDGFATFDGDQPPKEGNYMTTLTSVNTTLSKGELTLASPDPFTYPLINPNLLSHPFDLKAMVQVIKDTQRFLSTSPWANYVISPIGPLSQADSDEKKEQFARNYSAALNHPCGTVRMGKPGAGAVDSQGRIYRVKGLRVVDSSIFPAIPECHIQALVYVIAERVADLIKGQYELHCEDLSAKL